MTFKAQKEDVLLTNSKYPREGAERGDEEEEDDAAAGVGEEEPEEDKAGAFRGDVGDFSKKEPNSKGIERSEKM